MSYEKRTDIPCAVGELVVALSTDDPGVTYLAAVQCPAVRDPASNDVVFSPRARWIDANGAQQVDAAGAQVSTSYTFNASAAKLAAVPADAIARECLLLVIGEPLTADPALPEANLLRLGGGNVAQCSIRSAIAAAWVAVAVASEVL